MSDMQANFAGKIADLSQIQVMGVLNVTPDSFSDGGRFNSLDAAVAQEEMMVAEGASIIDIGGESTRPGAAKISVQEEMDRVCPIVERLVNETDAVISIDTSTPELMTEVLGLGVGMINDVRAFTKEGAVEAVANADAMLCLMHMQGEPQTMQQDPSYESVVKDVSNFLLDRVSTLTNAGVQSEKIVLDPGFGFGKSLDHNLALLNHIQDIVVLGYPVLIGVSRKSMFGQILDKPVDQRLYASLAGAVLAAHQGARIIRVHDVEATVDALKVVSALSYNKAQFG